MAGTKNKSVGSSAKKNDSAVWEKRPAKETPWRQDGAPGGRGAAGKSGAGERGQVVPGRATNQKKKNKQQGVYFIFAAVAVLIVLIAGAMVFSNMYFVDHAAFGAVLAGEDVGGKDKAEIAAIAETLSDKIEFQFEYEGTLSEKITPAALGLTLNAIGTADDVINKGKAKNPLSRLNPFQTKTMDLVYEKNLDTMQACLNEIYKEKITPVKEPSVKFSGKSQKFIIGKGQGGQIVSATTLNDWLGKRGPTLENAVYKVILQDELPVVSDEEGLKTGDEVNEIIRLNLKLKDEDGDTVFTASREDISKWIALKPDEATGKYMISINKKKVEAFVKGPVAKKINREPSAKKILVGRNDQELNLIQEGENGLTMSNVPEIVEGLYNAASQKKSADQKVVMSAESYKTERVSAMGTNWVEVDLSAQKTILWNGDTKLRTFTISSGKSRTPTVKGDYKVYLKRTVQTMSGGSKKDGTYYRTPNVRWISYFFEGYAFHATYWHNNFGTPMSHGCINMRTEEAKIVYDFAPIGTRVLVHD